MGDFFIIIYVAFGSAFSSKLCNVMTFAGASCYTWLPSGGHIRYCFTKVQRNLFPYDFVVLTTVVASSKPQHMFKDCIFYFFCIRVLQYITNNSNSNFEMF